MDVNEKILQSAYGLTEAHAKDMRAGMLGKSSALEAQVAALTTERDNLRKALSQLTDAILNRGWAVAVDPAKRRLYENAVEALRSDK